VKVDGDEDSWDFGTGAGFYVDATEEKWKKHYRMYSYIVKELPAIIYESMPIVSPKQTLYAYICLFGYHAADIQCLG
jgi:S-formylglutathione hydrolase